MKTNVTRLLTAGLFACTAGMALADGIPTAANVMDAPIGANEWRGFYVSGALGYGWSDSSQHLILDSGSDGSIDVDEKKSFEADGFLGSLGLGYDIMLRDNLLIGAFADYSFGDLEDKYSIAGVPVTAKYEDIWAIGGRVGVIVHKDMLLYGTAGYTSTEFSVRNPGGKGSEDLDGFFVGVGLERLLHNNLYLRAEYRYSNYDDVKSREVVENDAGKCGTPDDCTVWNDFENEIHSIRVGLAYKFGRRDEAPAPLK